MKDAANKLRDQEADDLSSQSEDNEWPSKYLKKPPRGDSRTKSTNEVANMGK